MPGEYQSPAVHALAHAINARLGNVGKTVFHAAPAEVRPVDQMASIRGARRRHGAGRGQPAGRARRATPPSPRPRTWTSRRRWTGCRCACTWACTTTRPPSAAIGTCRRRTRWKRGATRAPTTAPSPSSSRSSRPCTRGASRPTRCWPPSPRGRPCKGHDVVRDYWRAGGALGADFERGWRRALHDGVVAGSALPALARLRLRRHDAPRPVAAAPAPTAGMEIAFRPDPDHRRRPLREQRLAAGAAEAADQAHLGQRGPHEPRHRAPPRHLHRAHRPRRADRRRRAALPRPQRPGPGVDHARPSRRHRDRPLRLRPPADGARRQRHRLRRLRAAHQRRAVVRPRAGGGEDRRPLHPGLHAGPLEHGAPRRGPRANAGRVPRDPRLRAQGGARAVARDDHVPQLPVRGARLGDVDRPQRLRGMQRVRGGLPGGEQHPGGGQAAGRR